MQLDFHYYATYCAACLSGYSHRECLEICYSAQFVDCCSRILLRKLKAPLSAATTQLQMEMMDAPTDLLGRQDITRIWASFHFLPKDLYAPAKKGWSKSYRDKYRLICGPSGELTEETVKLAKGRSLQAAGIAMHVLADTWAHRYFAGTPSLVINNVNEYCIELVEEEGDIWERSVRFRHNPSGIDDLWQGIYTSTIMQAQEDSVMNLGHGRAGHLPDYSFMRYKYLPAWGDYREILKDNPADYRNAFCQMVCAMKYLRGTEERFDKDQCEAAEVKPLEEEIRSILCARRPDASEDWKKLGERLSGETIPPFDEERYMEEYISAGPEDKDKTFLGRFFLSAMAQKSMVTNRIFTSGNRLAGFSVDFERSGFKGVRDYKKLVEAVHREKLKKETRE